ncbi:Piwi-domain-containing protein [Lanmaoa asiatica]|nr:Piwi-domain-containing protein [Lanmaoa asiatica]
MSSNRGGDNRGRGRGRGQPRGGGGAPSPSGSGPRRGSPSGYQPGGGQGGFRGGRGGGGGPTGAGPSGDTVFGGDPVLTLRVLPVPVSGHSANLEFSGPTSSQSRFPKTGIIYDYHIEFTPKTDLKSIKARLFTLLEQSTHTGWQEYVPFIAHDGSARLVSSKKLPQPLDVPVLFLKEGQTQPGKHDKTYTISITFTQELNFSELDSFMSGDPNFRNWDFAPIVSAQNLVLQHHASHNGVRVGKNRYFFPSSGQPLDLSIGVEAWRGFFMSARPVYKELMVNVGVCMTAFYKPGNLAQAIMEFQRQSHGAMLHRFAQKLKVTTSHLGYKQTKPLKKIISTTAKTTSFQCDEFNGKVTVEQYFKRKYKINLKYPNLPVVDISGPNARHPILVPAELCEILPGQPFRGRLDDQQTTLMLRFACKRPAENAQTILNQGFPQLGLTPNNQKLGELWHLGQSRHGLRPISGAPSSGRQLQGRQAAEREQWELEHPRRQIPCWRIPSSMDPVTLSLLPSGKDSRENVKGVGCQGSLPDNAPPLLNVNMVDPAGDPGRLQSLNSIRSAIRENQARRGTPSFMLVILSKRDNYIYPGIKRICDVELGIHTIHMLSNKVLTEPRKQDQYFSNVALKVNTKLGGINHKIDDKSLQWLTKTKTMLVGMDVTHPGPGSIEGTPSIAAVVASVDSNFAQFPASLRCQETKKEMITELSPMMVERLKRYQEVSRSLPDRVYVFRDGVSEGQFDTVLNEELPQILDAFGRVNPRGGPQGKPYRPQLTIVICGKRHHAREWPPNELGDKNGNPRPGTVVDQGITAVFDFDFYLQAHAGLQGHAKPTHYTVVYDESRLGADEVQQGVNTASYLYARATKAVSLIPPAYYSDLACERGRCYLNDFLVSDDKTTTTSKGKSKLDKEEEKKKVFDAAVKAWGNGVHPNLAGSMFYI